MIKTVFGNMGSGYTCTDYLNELAIIINLRDIVFSAEADYDEYKFKKDE